MAKGYIFDLLKIENGWIVTLFSLFRIGWLKAGEDNRFYKCLQLGIGTIELTISIGWNNSSITVDGNVRGVS